MPYSVFLTLRQCFRTILVPESNTRLNHVLMNEAISVTGESMLHQEDPLEEEYFSTDKTTLVKLVFNAN